VAYGQSRYSAGVSPIWGSNPWIEELRTYIRKSTASDEITFISQTSTKFESLIRDALEVGAKVRIYVYDGYMRSKSKASNDPKARVKKNIGKNSDKAQILGFEYPATYRAVVIGDVAIGLQPYISVAEKSGDVETIKKMPLCFIVTQCFSAFPKLKESVLTFF
jgi:hypothetical protein